MAAGQTDIEGFRADNCTQMAAAIAYYVLFAIVPLTIFVVSIVGLVAGSEDVRQRIAEKVTDYLEVDTGDVVFELDQDNVDDIEARYGSDGVAAIEQELAALNGPEASNISALTELDSVLVLVTREGGIQWTFDP